MGWLARLLAALTPPRREPPAPSEDPEDPADPADEEGPDPGDVAVVPIDGEIDLHHFAPRDVPSVVDEVLRASREKGLSEVTIIHGRGKGVQRQVVWRILEKHPAVEGFAPAVGARGLGATVATLRPPRPARRGGGRGGGPRRRA